MDTLKAYGAYEGNAFTFIHGFCKQITELFSRCLSFEDILQKSGCGSLDQIFLAALYKIFEERGVSELNDSKTALVCAELAGEIFDLDNKTIYSFEVWQKRLRKRIEETKMLDLLSFGSNTEMGTNLLDILRDSAKTLISKQSRTKLAGSMIAELLNTHEYKRPAASLTVLPESFLAGVYLAATQLV